MDYRIVEVDLDDRELLGKANRLVGETFGAEVPDDKLEKITGTNSANKSLYLAAEQDGEVIGFNAFISHEFFLNGSTINCYQSCWTATSNAHRGKKIFQNLINEAKEILTSRGAAFIFGFPNANSQPIFTQKLGFKEIPSLKWQVPNISIIRDRYVNVSVGTGADGNAITQNDRQLIELKRKQYGDELLAVEHSDSLLWGVPRENKKFGLSLRYLDIGGIYIRAAKDTSPLFEKLWSAANRFHYFQLSTTRGNTFNKFLNDLNPAQTNDLIVFDLNLETGPDTHFNFFGGVKDVF